MIQKAVSEKKLSAQARAISSLAIFRFARLSGKLHIY